MRPLLRCIAAYGLTTALAAAPAGKAPTVSVAAAANLIHAIEALNAGFTRTAPEVAVTTATGVSGGLYAQIVHGAPFDVFLSADTDYPQQLVAQQHGDAASLRVFATGRLALWTMRTDLELGDLAALAGDPRVKKIAIAQPKTAPYGRAAQDALARAGAWTAARPKIVFGESVAQTAQFVETGAADAGLVALSLLRSPRLAGKGRWREIPAAWHAAVSLDHAAVLTRRGAANPAARRYLEYLTSGAAKEILRDHGYAVP
jgi:molybdate transport system substrate-binding protein